MRPRKWHLRPLYYIGFSALFDENSKNPLGTKRLSKKKNAPVGCVCVIIFPEFRLRRIFAHLAAYERARRALRRRMRTGFCRLRRQSAILFVRSTTKKKSTAFAVLFFLEAPPGIEPGIEVLQTFALPLGHSALFYI